MPARVAAAVVPLLAVVALPVLVLARVGPGAGAVFAATWSVAVVIGAAATIVVWRSIRAPDPGTGADVRRTACERALLVAVPVVVVVLVGSPWILATFGRHVRDTGVGSLVVLALATVPYVVIAVVSRAAAVAGRTAGALVAPAVALVVAACVGWVALPVLGVLGAASGWLLAQSLVAATLLVRDRSMITAAVA